MEQVEAYLRKLDDLPQKEKSRLCLMAAGVCFFFFFILLIVYASSMTREVSLSKRRVVVTTEAMPDDLVALKYLFKRADVHVRAIVVVPNGITNNVAAQLDVIRRFLALLILEGCSDCRTVELGYGDTRPSVMRGGEACALSGIVPPSLRTAVDGGFGNRENPDFYKSLRRVVADGNTRWGDSAQQRRPLTAKQACAAAFGASENIDDVEYLSLGPMTHVGVCHGDGSSSPRRVVASGGAFSAAGNVQDVYPLSMGRNELNIFFDPRAAATLLHDGQMVKKGVYLVPLDASIDLFGEPRVWSALVTDMMGASGSNLFIARALARLSQVTERPLGKAKALVSLHDTVAAMLLVGRDVAQSFVGPLVDQTLEVLASDEIPLGEVGEVHQFTRSGVAPINVLLGHGKKESETFLALLSQTMQLQFPRSA